MLYCRLAHTLVKKNLVWALKRRKIPRALEVGNIINGFNWILIKSQIMQLCIQSYLSEELYFIAVTSRTTTGTDVWETLLVNHICSEVLTEKKTWLTVSRVGEEELAIWRRSLSKSFSSTFLYKLSFRFSFISVFISSLCLSFFLLACVWQMGLY